MGSLGLLLLLGGAMLLRQVVTGRVPDTVSDFKGITLSVLTGDFPGLQQQLALRGTNVSPDITSEVAAGMSGETALAGSDGASGLLTGPVQTGNRDLLNRAVSLGQSAKGYHLGATGPDWYDCSGLVWAAMKQQGSYTGARFTTSTFQRQLTGLVTKVTTPAVGDIVLWPGKHMGIVSGKGKMFSAMSPAAGIGFGDIDGSSGYFHSQPVYYRVNDGTGTVLKPAPKIQVMK